MVRGVGVELRGAGVDGLEHRVDAEPLPQRADPGLTGQFRSQRGDLTVRKAVVLGSPKQILVEDRRVDELAAQRDQAVDLLDEPGVHTRGLGDLLDACAHPQGQLDVVEAALGRCPQPLEHVGHPAVVVGCGPEPGPGGLQ